jgi:hypothetical protein
MSCKFLTTRVSSFRRNDIKISISIFCEIIKQTFRITIIIHDPYP